MYKLPHKLDPPQFNVFVHLLKDSQREAMV